MKLLNKKIKVVVLLLFLIIFSTLFIIGNGNTYTIKEKNINEIDNIDRINVVIENKEIIRLIDKNIKNGVLKIKVKSISKGKTFINIEDAEGKFSKIDVLYVHKFGIITFSEYLGDCSGCIIIPISIIIFLVYLLYILIKSYKNSIKINMYQYKNIAYMGICVFITFTISSQLFSIWNYSGLINTINELLNTFSFTIIIFPIAFIVSILVIISNISLILKEGYGIRNILGIALGIFVCLATIAPGILYQSLYSETWIDIHNQNGIGLYIYNLFETILYIGITYFECVLIGTIIMGFKSAKHIPKFDKDFIIILGCQIKKDGTLTNLLKSRVDRAIEFSKIQKEKTGKKIIFVPSGGKGNDEIISEAQAMKNYLLEQGINEKDILIEDKSKNTFENIKYSNKLIIEKNKNAKIAFSTTNYHVLRAGSIATEQNIYIEGIGARTKSYFWVNAFIREFIATLFVEKKKHIAVLISILITAIFMIGITYLNNNI